MENFGVLPLLRFAAFLRRPSFFLLKALRALVTLVLEAISYPPEAISLIAKIANLVKTLALLSLFAPQIQASGQVLAPKDIILAKGEHRGLKISDLSHFTVGNNEVISHKYLVGKKLFVIKGKSTGFTELILWKKNKTKQTYRIYVLRKSQHLKILHSNETLNKLGLKTEISGTTILVTGEIKTLENFRLLIQLARKNGDYLHINVDISKKLERKILGKIYKIFFDQHIDQISCRLIKLVFYCHYFNQVPLDKKFSKYLKDQFNVELILTSSIQSHKNFKVNLKIIQIENIRGREISLGLNGIVAKLSDIFEKPLSKLVSENQVLLKQHDLNFSTLAQPKAILQINQPLQIRFGSDIPYYHNQSDPENSNLQWKFVGMIFHLTLKAKNNSLIAKIETKFSHLQGASSSIADNSQKSSIIINIGKGVKVFEILFQTHSLNKHSLPFLSSIPVLGKIFLSSNNQTSYKKIIGVLLVNNE